MNRDAYLQAIRHHLQTAYLLTEEKTEEMIPVFVATLGDHVEPDRARGQGRPAQHGPA
jgi:hypothetical protein